MTEQEYLRYLARKPILINLAHARGTISARTVYMCLRSRFRDVVNELRKIHNLGKGNRNKTFAAVVAKFSEQIIKIKLKCLTVRERMVEHIILQIGRVVVW